MLRDLLFWVVICGWRGFVGVVILLGLGCFMWLRFAGISGCLRGVGVWF